MFVEPSALARVSSTTVTGVGALKPELDAIREPVTTIGSPASAPGSEVVSLEDDQGMYAETVFEFGLQLVEATESATLLRLIAPLALRTLRYSLFGLRSSERRQRSIALWRREREAIAQGDAETAANAAVTRVLQSRDEALRLIAAESGGNSKLE